MAYVTVNQFSDQLKKIGDKTLYSGEDVSLNSKNLEKITGDLDKFNFVDLMNVLSYKNATVSLTSSLPTLIYELGVTIPGGQTLTATVAKGSSPIASVEFFRNGTSASLIVDGVSDGGNFTYASGINIANDETYKVIVTCEDGNTVEDTLAVKFYNPYYHGVTSKDLDEITVTDVVGMIKDVSGIEEKKYSYTSANEYCVLAYPKEYGTLSSILDSSNFQNLESWEYKELEVNNIPYLVYKTETVVICTNFEYKFK